MNTWSNKKSYIEAWWRPNVTRGYLFLDRPPTEEFQPWPSTSPPFRINEDITKLKVFPKISRPIQVRIVRTIMETFRQGDNDVRWYVMGDDDTVLMVDNLVEVLAKYDHTKSYYIGFNSDCVKSNFDFSFNMAFGGAGYALSYPLAEALATKLDDCIERYPDMYVSDFLLHSCLADLGVALTQNKGFHQVIATSLVEVGYYIYVCPVEHIEGDQIVTTYVRAWPRGLPTCSFAGNHSADPITKIKVFSLASTRLEGGGRDCCDIEYMDGANVTEVKYRTCMKYEIIA
ncbi:hypothetical protein SO802_019605 [Lithocarpus litseifolius]|uniref:Uncharacterized protein n=1 Tax=Lithocarpus litseifolius TaxID=425828 RepID=A0AAW2CP81_9ROSI